MDRGLSASNAVPEFDESPQAHVTRIVQFQPTAFGEGRVLTPEGWSDNGREAYIAATLARRFEADVWMAPYIPDLPDGVKQFDAWIDFGEIEAWEFERVTPSAANPRTAAIKRLREGSRQSSRLVLFIDNDAATDAMLNRALGSAFARYAERIERIIFLARDGRTASITPTQFDDGDRIRLFQR